MGVLSRGPRGGSRRVHKSEESCHTFGRNQLSPRFFLRAERKIRRRRGDKSQLLTRPRMPDGQLPGVQHLAREIGPASVDPVARDGEPQMFEVNPDLVGSPGFWPALKEAEFRVRRENFPCCLRGARFRSVRYGHALAVNRVPGDRAGDHAGRGARFSPHHGEVGLLGCSLGELPRQRGVRGVVFCDENATACVLVEAVDHARAQGMTGRGQLRCVVHHGVDQRAAPMSCRRMHDQPRRLVQAK